MRDEIDSLLQQLERPDPRLPTAQARQAAVWRGEEPDFLPLLCESAAQPWDGERFALAEQAEDSEKMLYEGLLGSVRQLPLQSDSVLSIRPQFGVGCLVTAFGVEYELSTTYGTPWVVSRLSRDELARMEPDDLDLDGSLVGRACRFLEQWASRLGVRLAVYLPDTQGPFGIAHQARGHDIFTDMFDDPPLVHHLMELTTHLYVEATRRLKAAAGEPLDSGHHDGSLYMERCGVRMCDDSGILASPALFGEFVVPYHRRALAPFGGGWVHWCGHRPQLLEAYLQIPEVRAVNFGNPEMYEPETVLPQLVQAGKLYFGSWPWRPDEGLDAYFDRILEPLAGGKRGLILTGAQDGATPETPEVMSRWREAQARAGR